MTHEEEANPFYPESRVYGPDDRAWPRVQVGVELAIDESNSACPASLGVGDEIGRRLFLRRLHPHGIPPFIELYRSSRKNLPMLTIIGDV